MVEFKKIYPAVLGSIEKVAACYEKRCKQNYWILFRKWNISPYLVTLSLKNRLCSSCSISRSTPQGKKWGLALMCSYFLRVLPATLVACVAGCLPGCLARLPRLSRQPRLRWKWLQCVSVWEMTEEKEDVCEKGRECKKCVCVCVREIGTPKQWQRACEHTTKVSTC